MLRLDKFKKYPLTFGPSPIEHLPRLTAALGGNIQIYAKRDDCNSGLAMGGNKLHGDQLISLPGVRQTRTFFVMKEVVDNAPLDF